MVLRGMRTICIDAWNQAGIFEASFSLRAAMSGAERDDATIKIAKLEKKSIGEDKCMTVGFKAGQSARGGLGIEREVSQTLSSHMSALEPTLFRCQSFAQNTREEVRKVNGDGRVASALSAETGTHQTNYIKSEKKEKGETMLKAEVRRLTPVEGGRLQGFPEGYLDCLSADSTKYRVEGNSWAVPCARFVNKGIHRVLAKLEGKWRGLRYGTISSGVEAHSMSSVGFGDKTVFFSEIDPSPSSVLAHHYPDVPNLGDMTLVDYDAEKGVIHNRPYEGYKAPDEADMGFKPYATETPVEIPFKHGEIDLVSGGTPCFTKGSYVLTDEGYKPIEDVKVGDLVVTHLGHFRKVVAVGHKNSNDVYRVKIKNRPSFGVTGNHPFWCGTFTRDWNESERNWSPLKLDKLDWCPVKNLNEDSYAALFNFKKMENTVVPVFPTVYHANTLEISELIGWYLGDGYIRRWKGKSKKAIVLCLNDAKVKEFEKQFKEVINYTLCHNRTATKVQICCTALADYISEMFGELSHQKRIAASVYFWRKDIREALINGYFKTDGCRLSGKIPGSRFTTVSPALAYGMADLIGKSSVGIFHRPPTCVIEGRVVNQRDTLTVTVNDSTRTFHSHDKWDFVKVNEVVRTNSDTVYNIEVEGDHSYICNGFCVHNCQSFSVAGKRHGGAEGSGTRSALAFQLPRIGKAVGSKFIMWENVPGAFSSAKGRDFLWFLYRCMEAGYTLAWRTLDAQFVRSDTHPRAVPQRRRRIWMVGYKGDDWRIPVQVLFEPMRVLGDEPPKRVTGKGFTSLLDKNAETNQKSDVEEFKEFLAAANPRIVKFCVDHGLSDPPEQTLKELEDAESAKKSAGGDDMFALFAPPEEKHQGRGLKAADLDLHLPDEDDIRSVGTPGLFRWAREVSESIGYCGEIFQNWKWKQNLYCEATDPKDVYDGHCGKGAWDKLSEEDKKKVFPELTPEAFYDRFHGKDAWKALSDEDRQEVFYESVYDKVKTDEKSVYTLSETARFNIGNAGILSDGILCTMKTPEWNAGVTEEELAEMPKELAELYDGDICGLCDILEANPSVIYKLSWRACYGICNRAKMRGKKLPIELAVALVERIIEQAAFVKWMAINGNKVSKQAGVKSESEIAKIAFDDYIEAEAHWADVTEQQPTKSCELDDIEEDGDDAGEGEDGAEGEAE